MKRDLTEGMSKKTLTNLYCCARFETGYTAGACHTWVHVSPAAWFRIALTHLMMCVTPASSRNRRRLSNRLSGSKSASRTSIMWRAVRSTRSGLRPVADNIGRPHTKATRFGDNCGAVKRYRA